MSVFDACHRTLRRFVLHTGGVGAVEFAILLPLIVLLYVGAGELSQAVMTSRKVELLSRTLADLTSKQATSSQATSIPVPGNAMPQSTIESIFNASLAVMAPNPITSLKMTVSAVDIVNNPAGLCCNFNVRWSYTQGGTLRPCQTPLTPVPPAQAPSPGTVSSALVPQMPVLDEPISLLIADVSYVYSGPFSSQWLDLSSGTSRTSYMFPRTTGQVVLQSPVAANGTRTGVICY